MKKISLIGAPTDIGASELGASLGPDALRIAGLSQALVSRGYEIAQDYNLSGPPNPNQPNTNGSRHLKEVVVWNKLIHSAVQQALQSNQLPFLLGGDHCLAIGSIAAVAQHCKQQGKKLKVIWFDAHTDANTPSISPSGNIHGMPVAVLLGYGHEILTEIVKDPLSIDQISQIGIRSVDDEERLFVQNLGLDVFDMRYIDEVGVRQAMLNSLKQCDQNTHLHVSFDLDSLDPSIAPGVSTAVKGGLSYREIQLCMELIADTGLLGSVDLVELNPTRDIANETARLAVELIESLFGKSTLIRQTPT